MKLGRQTALSLVGAALGGCAGAQAGLAGFGFAPRTTGTGERNKQKQVPAWPQKTNKPCWLTCRAGPMNRGTTSFDPSTQRHVPSLLQGNDFDCARTTTRHYRKVKIKQRMVVRDGKVGGKEPRPRPGPFSFNVYCFLISGPASSMPPFTNSVFTSDF
jgi:hypothetical protein